ncbi:CoA transferase [Pseudomonas sp. TCU-HL1]|uniref:CoA transferase n=1 Tax=Pseudomonas sp. TCU-HL1 TaxID=1856685 RepID=UPI00083E57C1|nr:CoA transferase [Pseudomonas sp. TCU-HL1]AOE86780.1 dehydratase [Pseudomonas sp. TCU-HL1]
MDGAILKGLRVIEASAFVAAPLGGMTLAQLGAEVIRIDGLQGGLDYRRWPVSDDGTSLFWAGLNKSKRSVCLDLGSPQGRELARALIVAPGEDAGILLTNLPPRGWLDYEALRTERQDLIQLTVQGDRSGGSAVDYTVNPRLGLPYLTGPQATEGAVNHVLPAWDLITGQMAALGLLAAERQRRRQGTGQHVKLALEDVALAVMAHLGFLAEAQNGQQRQRYGNDLFGAFGRDFLTGDGERIMVVGLTLKQWRNLCEATGIVEQVRLLETRLGVDLSLEGERFRAREELAALIAPWVAARTLAQLREAFDSCSVCWSRYQSVSQLLHEDPACSEANPMFRQLDQPGIGPVLSPAIPLRFDEQRLPAQPAPRLGADTEAVLTELLGLSCAEVGRLHDQGVVRCA